MALGGEYAAFVKQLSDHANKTVEAVATPDPLPDPSSSSSAAAAAAAAAAPSTAADAEEKQVAAAAAPRAAADDERLNAQLQSVMAQVQPHTAKENSAAAGGVAGTPGRHAPSVGDRALTAGELDALADLRRTLERIEGGAEAEAEANLQRTGTTG